MTNEKWTWLEDIEQYYSDELDSLECPTSRQEMRDMSKLIACIKQMREALEKSQTILSHIAIGDSSKIEHINGALSNQEYARLAFHKMKKTLTRCASGVFDVSTAGRAPKEDV